LNWRRPARKSVLVWIGPGCGVEKKKDPTWRGRKLLTRRSTSTGGEEGPSTGFWRLVQKPNESRKETAESLLILHVFASLTEGENREVLADPPLDSENVSEKDLQPDLVNPG